MAGTDQGQARLIVTGQLQIKPFIPFCLIGEEGFCIPWSLKCRTCIMQLSLFTYFSVQMSTPAS